jgi:hypothetical protein
MKSGNRSHLYLHSPRRSKSSGTGERTLGLVRDLGEDEKQQQRLEEEEGVVGVGVQLV